jgi:hypothetical protein
MMKLILRGARTKQSDSCAAGYGNISDGCRPKTELDLFGEPITEDWPIPFSLKAKRPREAVAFIDRL